jgi:hypothetical protein
VGTGIDVLFVARLSGNWQTRHNPDCGSAAEQERSNAWVLLFADDQPMNAATKAVSIVDRVQLVRIRIFFGHANGNMASVMIGALLIATVLHSGGVSLRTLAVWGLAIGLASAGVLLFERYVARVGVTVENCRRLAYVRIGLGAGIALFYGLSGFLLPGAVPAAGHVSIHHCLDTGHRRCPGLRHGAGVLPHPERGQSAATDRTFFSSNTWLLGTATICCC